jgi:hypothetical protein
VARVARAVQGRAEFKPVHHIGCARVMSGASESAFASGGVEATAFVAAAPSAIGSVMNVLADQRMPALAERERLAPPVAIHSALFGRIRHVFAVSPEEEMAGITARPVVAVMTDARPFGDLSVGDHPGHAVSRMDPQASPVSDSEHPVPVSAFAGDPWPARMGSSRAIHLRPEAISDRDTSSRRHAFNRITTQEG